MTKTFFEAEANGFDDVWRYDAKRQDDLTSFVVSVLLSDSTDLLLDAAKAGKRAD